MVCWLGARGSCQNRCIPYVTALTMLLVHQEGTQSKCAYLRFRKYQETGGCWSARSFVIRSFHRMLGRRPELGTTR